MKLRTDHYFYQEGEGGGQFCLFGDGLCKNLLKPNAGPGL